ncbi:5-formyltetrahydrofolate cyclo-ligase [Haliea sp. E1-2-M8]|uniref:5-formyltetrahydrofolate cyclo-ligase n=1 Tax=Haliea sp. E1-2-M8 TaxID=3064706 RepID=UPI002715FC73|nr:5-formyltetrahydrofolate cyclo-ligase [Haliea sp. E1-2-M8]MDO8860229.1 5-formyltetrahydrofolate cyclo-ligase [Haliea sp. E1-2-M8]
MSPEQQAKPALRKYLRRKRQALAPAFRAQAATAAAALAAGLPGWHTARHIAFYWPNDGELDPRPLAAACREQQRNLYLPVLAGDNRLIFRRWDADTTLPVNQFGIPEPQPGSPEPDTAELDIVFLPLVGWQRDGYRLGMGGGFYDRTLAGPAGPLRVGMGFSCQELTGQMAERWDVALDYVLTETILHRCADAECP